MLLRMVGSLILGIAVLAAGSHAGGDKEKKSDKKAKGIEVKNAAKDPRAVKGKVVSVDIKGKAFTIAVGEEKKTEERSFGVTKETGYFGPRGAKGEGLKDDRFAKGYDLIVIPSKDGKSAEEVHFSYRKLEEKKKEKAPTKEKKKKK